MKDRRPNGTLYRKEQKTQDICDAVLVRFPEGLVLDLFNGSGTLGGCAVLNTLCHPFDLDLTRVFFSGASAIYY